MNVNPSPAAESTFAPPRATPARWSDAALAAVLVAVSVGWLFTDIEDTTREVVREPDVLGAVLVAVACAAVAFRRPFPAVAALVATAAAGAAAMPGYPAMVPVVVALALCGRAAVHTDRTATIVVGAFSGLQVMGIALSGVGDAPLLRGIVGFAAGLVPVLVGNKLRGERIRTGEAQELARSVEELRDRDVERAVAQERLRIARDVHDITGHHLSAISLQAAGAGRQTPDPVARAALERIHGLTTEALGQTRRALGVLRASGPAVLAPAPRLAQVEELLAPARGAGLAVDLRLRGRERPLSEEVEVCAYRLVQESLTNVVRHAGAGEVVVRVEYCERELFVAIDDDGVGGPLRRHGGGLDGMRERVALVGGSFDAGPVGRRGWSVRATLPLEEVA